MRYSIMATPPYTKYFAAIFKCILVEVNISHAINMILIGGRKRNPCKT